MEQPADVLTYADLRPGRELLSVSYDMTPALVARYLVACGLHDSPYPGVPPLLSAAAGGLRATLPGSIPYGSLHVRDELDVHGLARVGDRLSTRTWVGNRYEKRGRGYVVFAQEVVDQDGRLLVSGRRTNLWGA